MMRKTAGALLALTLFSASALAKDDSTVAAIHHDGSIRFGTEGTYPPYTYHDASGKLVGFDVDIARAIADKMGVKPVFIEGRWDGLIAGLAAKRYDAVINQVGITPARQAKFDFSDPYIGSSAVLIVRDDNTHIQHFSDLHGQKAAQSLTSHYAKLAEQYGAEVVPTDSFNQSLELVMSGRAAATLNDNLSYLDFRQHKPNAPLKVVAIADQRAESAILVRKNQPQLVQALNRALAEIRADGTYRTISQRYFGRDISQ